MLLQLMHPYMPGTDTINESTFISIFYFPQDPRQFSVEIRKAGLVKNYHHFHTLGEAVQFAERTSREMSGRKKTYWSYACDCIDIDELRDSAGDGGCPTSIDLRLFATRDQALAAMLEEINDQRQQYFDSDEDEENPGVITDYNLEGPNKSIYSSESMGQEWYLVEYTVTE